ncbi:F-box protein [Rhynchospora pubera]|uniref:F-box protein n=1 Tax=Rhynchospora pubera TaxID=906938 RepID=A0AAV8DCK2_9POAL|nr:F-box protein [Rhynchospora pubera]KAJ4763971.1 F-box protein [Rhynchospora pubera]
MGRGEDRISNLPNEILQFIICLMPLKYAIRASVLSKRWRHLWQFNLVSSTSLQFDEDFSCNQSPKQFVTTLDQYLHLHGDRSLDKFGILFSSFDIFFPNLEKWIATVLAKGVKELKIDLSQGILYTPGDSYIDDRMPFVIPNPLFNCKSLTHLSLSRCNFSDPLVSANFVRLSSLSLDNVNLLTDAMLTSILEYCVLLESISLKRCEILDTVKFVGEKLKLQKLVIVDCNNVLDIEISAPKLESFLYHGWISFSHVFGNVSKVNDAYLCSPGSEEFDLVFTGILSDLSHVKILTICSMGLLHLAFLEDAHYHDYFPLQLHNLQELQLVLDSIHEDDIYCIFSFFRFCPSSFLEKLFIQLPFPSKFLCVESNSATAEEIISEIEFPSLKCIKIANFGGSSQELKLVKFFLEKAIMLESIFILMNQCDDSNNSLSRRIIEGQLSVMPKASKDARIVICGQLDHDCSINPTHAKLYYDENYRNGTTMHEGKRRKNIPLDQEFL